MEESSHAVKFRRDKEGKIDLIINTFLRLVDQQGYSKVSTNQVAKEAGLSIGTIYRYFPEGKAEILRESFKGISADFMQFSDILKIILENDITIIESFIRKYVKAHRDYYQLHKAYDQALLSNRDLFLNYQKNMIDFIKQFTEQAKIVDPRILQIPENAIIKAMLLNLNVIESLVHHHLFYDPIFENDEDLIRYLVQIFRFTNEIYLKR